MKASSGTKPPRRSSTTVNSFLSPLTYLIQTHKQASVEDDGLKEDVVKHIWCSLDGLSWNLANLAAAVDPSSEEVLIYDPQVVQPEDVPDDLNLPVPPGLATLKIPKSSTHTFDHSHLQSYTDASLLNNLHEAPLLYLLMSRFASNDIYTNCSDVLISVNPYKLIPDFYGSETMDEVYTIGKDLNSRRMKSNESIPDERLPHVFVIADRAYTAMCSSTSKSRSTTTKLNQSVIISGESGAGKTEAAKYVMSYLIHASKKSSLDSSNNVYNVDSIAESLMRSNSILEAFGNAKTVRNDNSSRFGKYIKLMYSNTHNLMGAYTENFLLEKTRLMQADSGERNYHVFYQLLAGLDSSTKATLCLDDASSYKMLGNGNCYTVDNVDDQEEFEVLKRALDTVNIRGKEYDDLIETLAALLHLGNIVFEGPDDGITPVCGVDIEKLSAMLGVESQALTQALTIRNVRSGRGSLMSVNLNPVQARDGCNALIKYVYGEIFSWLVKKINISNNNESNAQPASFIGILDIFGFEIMQYNSLSQLCINYANEKLQQQFNYQIFVLEKELYKLEGLPVDVISFKDNQNVIDLIQKKPNGIVPILEELCFLGREISVNQIISSFDKPHNKVHENYQKPRFGNEEFIIKHFAGDVLYAADGMIAKNNDSLHDDLKILLNNSNKSFIVNTCTMGEEPDGSGYVEDMSDLMRTTSEIEAGEAEAEEARHGMAAKNTVTSVFRQQLAVLVETLHATEPYYIKCIKPNSSKSAGTANGPLVLEQLRYSGVLEVVRIRREGFPIRLSFKEFHKRFEILCFKDGFAPSRSANDEESQAASVHICKKCLADNDWAEGKTRIFVRNGIQERLQQLVHDVFASMSTKIQARQRAKVEKATFQKTQASTLMIQKLQRMHRQRKEFKDQKEKTIRAQAFLRAHVQHNQFVKQKAAAQKIEAIVRGHQASDGYKKTKATTKLQSRFRSRVAEKNLQAAKAAQTLLSARIKARQGKQLFDKQKDVATKLQALERQREAKKEFQEKKETAIKVENLFRMHHQKKEFEGQKKAAITLQAVGRKREAEAEYQKQRKAAELLHNHVRRFLAMSKLEHKKMGLFSGKKRRMNSMLFKPLGDYIEARDNGTLNQMLMKHNPEDEDLEIMFADDVEKFNRKGKGQPRQVIITKNFVYFLDKNAVKSFYDLRQGNQIIGSSLSSMADDFLVLHLQDDRDLLLTCQHKTELVTNLSRYSGGPYERDDLPMKCADEFQFETYGSGFSRAKTTQIASIRFVEDASITEEQKWKLNISGNTDFLVKVSPALCSGAKHPLGVPKAQRFEVMVGGRKTVTAAPSKLEKKSSSKGFSMGDAITRSMRKLSMSSRDSEKKDSGGK